MPRYDHMNRRISSQLSVTTIASLESVALPDDHGATTAGRRRGAAAPRSRRPDALACRR
jgi:hypothetical protein